mmetsp:Transcript_12340/g.12420  ORF Transcript_12340/g.12420 Transcript_12340/m.12420 type:complete len:116 (+) Transcript_12340:100-447(+)
MNFILFVCLSLLFIKNVHSYCEMTEGGYSAPITATQRYKTMLGSVKDQTAFSTFDLLRYCYQPVSGAHVMMEVETDGGAIHYFQAYVPSSHSGESPKLITTLSEENIKAYFQDPQ